MTKFSPFRRQPRKVADVKAVLALLTTCALMTAAALWLLAGWANAQESDPEPAPRPVPCESPIHCVLLDLTPHKSDLDEPAEQRSARLLEVANAFENVPYLHNRAALITIGIFESHFARDVMSCERTGDHGRAIGLFQSHAFAGRDDCPDAGEQVEMAWEQLRRSVNYCRRNGDGLEATIKRGFSLYARGNSCRWGGAHARVRVWRRVMARLWAYERKGGE
jgi:hypothetical protein